MCESEAGYFEVIWLMPWQLYESGVHADIGPAEEMGCSPLRQRINRQTPVLQLFIKTAAGDRQRPREPPIRMLTGEPGRDSALPQR